MTDPTVARLTFEKAVGRDPSPQEVATVLAAYLDRLPHEVEHSDKYRVLHGAPDLLPRLAKAGILLGLTSGAVEAAAHIKLARAGLNRYFPFGGYGSDSPDRTELTTCAIARGGRLIGQEIDPAQVFVVGDTPKDMEAAKGAGAIAIGTATVPGRGPSHVVCSWATGGLRWSHPPHALFMTPLRTALVVVAAVLAVAAGPAQAATVSVSGGVLTVAAAPGETNAIQLQPTPTDNSPADYEVVDDGAAATAGPGCRPEPTRTGSPVACAAAGVQRIVVRLGDGNDRVFWYGSSAAVPLELYGEAGNDDLTPPTQPAPGTLTDGGEGNDQVRGAADIARGGPGADTVIGARLVEGGEGNDQVYKSTVGSVPGKIDAGGGDDEVYSDDGKADDVTCGAGKDVVGRADNTDRPDATCESGKGVAVTAKPSITVFELPKGRARPGKDGRLAVWMKCSVANCAVTVQIRAAGEFKTKDFIRFKPRNAPIRKLTVGTKAKLYRIKLSRVQRRGMAKVGAYEGVAASVTAKGPGGRTTMLTDGLFCKRSDPCDSGGPAR